MKTNYRQLRHLLLAGLFVLPVVLQGCILVVEDDYLDRGRRFHGSEWYLEVVFYRAETFSAEDRQIDIAFGENNIVSGRSACGGFQGVYTLDEANRLTIEQLDLGSEACASNGTSAIFLDQLSNARRIDVQEDILRIETSGSDYLMFDRK